VIRPYREQDALALGALLESAWPDDATLREISAVHGSDVDSEDRWRRTLVYERAGEVLGAATLLASARHPSRYFVVVAVAPDVRRQGIGSDLLAACVALGDGRPLLARVREGDRAGIGFLRARGFDVLMRNRVGVVDPSDERVRAWVSESLSAGIERGACREELARAHEEAYAVEHASWAPATERPLEESLRLFCGESWLSETARVIRDQGRISAVAALHGPPLAPSEAELFLIAGSATRDAASLRAVVAADLDLAQSLGANVSIEADDANPQLTQILSELPAVMESTLLLLSSDAEPAAG
jgi:N-acetylglutamate synthase-like GNAT family acetyltransferase